MKLLLTGATGFVGRNFLLKAVDRYDRIHALVRNPARLRSQLEEDRIPGGRIVVHDLADSGWKVGEPVDHLVHAAASLFGRDREAIFEANVATTVALLEGLEGSPRIVLLSSQSAGGAAPVPGGARREADPDTPITWYGESKLQMEREVAERFGDREVRILRPPMILGARDLAEKPLFETTRGPLRIKPGLHAKRYSWIGVEDLVEAIRLALEGDRFEKPFYYVSAPGVITDRLLLETAARVSGGRGTTVPIPQPLVRAGAALVDCVPALRAAVPSLTRDRAREIWERDMVVDGSAFETDFAFRAKGSLEETLRSSWQWLSARSRHDP